MKNKFLALAAFGTAVLGGAILSAPANAQITQGNGPTSTINVNVSVPEILFLRTVQNAAVVIAPGDFLTGAGALTALPGTPPAGYVGSDQTTGAAGTPIDTASPFAVPAPSITKTITGAYIVWSNSPTGNYTIDIAEGPFTDANSNTLAVTVAAASEGSKPALGLTHTTASDIDLDIPVSATATAGSYAGILTVEAYRP